MDRASRRVYMCVICRKSLAGGLEKRAETLLPVVDELDCGDEDVEKEWNGPQGERKKETQRNHGGGWRQDAQVLTRPHPAIRWRLDRTKSNQTAYQFA